MTNSDWDFIKNMAREHHVTLTEAEVNKRMTLGQAIDSVLDVRHASRPT